MAKEGAYHGDRALFERAFAYWYQHEGDIPATAREFQVTERCVREWRLKFRWRERARELDREIEDRELRRLVKQREQTRARQRQVADLLIDKGLQKLAREEVLDKDETAIRALREGVQIMERLAGIPDWVVQVLGAGQGELERMVAEMEAQRRAAMGEDDDPWSDEDPDAAPEDGEEAGSDAQPEGNGAPEVTA